APEVIAEGEDKIAAFFKHEFIIVANLNRYVGERGRELMLIGYPGLKPPDASHVETAAISNADEMHTFDKKLLDMNGLVDRADGTKLKICKPDVGDPLPLLQAAAQKHLEVPSDDEPSDESTFDTAPDEDIAEAQDETGAIVRATGAVGANEIRGCSEEASESPHETEDSEEKREAVAGPSLAPLLPNKPEDLGG
ncbi:MAG: hypothetical protein ACREDA_03220, partial [Methylocella sp.]